MDSPCIGTCRLDEERMICRGCGRTIEEVAGWSKANEAEQAAIVAAAKARMVGMPRRGG